jgi:hypothetical protein
MAIIALQQNVTVTCPHCGDVSYYHDEHGISAGQIVLLSRRMCRSCGQRGVVVEVSTSALPPGVSVFELPMHTGRP